MNMCLFNSYFVELPCLFLCTAGCILMVSHLYQPYRSIDNNFTMIETKNDELQISHLVYLFPYQKQWLQQLSWFYLSSKILGFIFFIYPQDLRDKMLFYILPCLVLNTSINIISYLNNRLYLLRFYETEEYY